MCAESPVVGRLRVQTAEEGRVVIVRGAGRSGEIWKPQRRPALRTPE